MKLIKSVRTNELLSTIGETEAVRVTPMDCIDLPDSRTYIIHKGKVREVTKEYICAVSKSVTTLLPIKIIESLPEVK